MGFVLDAGGVEDTQVAVGSRHHDVRPESGLLTDFKGLLQALLGQREFHGVEELPGLLVEGYDLLDRFLVRSGRLGRQGKEEPGGGPQVEVSAEPKAYSFSRAHGLP